MGSYALGHSDRELDRLSHQAKMFGPFTRQLFEEAGIRPGMRVLDVGCGSGDVALLAAEMVGPQGEVVGVDRASLAVARARERAARFRVTNVRFVQGDPAKMDFDEAFDAVVGRLVLMYYPEPIVTVARLARHVRTGGIVVFQELDEENCKSLPQAPLFERAIGWVKSALQLSGAHVQMGLKLHATFLAAGLPAPRQRLDAVVGGGPECPVYDHIAEGVESLLPTLEELGIATRDEVEPQTLAQRIRDQVVERNGVAVSLGMVGAWTHKPATLGKAVRAD
jgi:SAM-dependent methyltransferase